MALFDLKKLTQYRNEILKAKLFMFLHDIGKLQPGHQAKFIRQYNSRRPATQFKHNTHIVSHPELSSISDWNSNLPPNATQISLKVVIEKHHGATEKNDGIWAVFAQRVDRMDSGWDRDSIVSTGVQPYKEFISVNSAFGWTRIAYERIDSLSDDIQCNQFPRPLYYAAPTGFDKQKEDCLDRLFRCLVSYVQINSNPASPMPNMGFFREPIRKVLQVITEKACGDTRYTVNDITLWDHSISTATLLKILAAWVVSTSPNLADNQNFPKSDDEKFHRWFHPQLLPLRIDGIGFLTASNNIPDLLARRELLQKVYDTWRDILEWEIPLAGEVYRDENGPVFLTFLRDEKGQGAIPLKSLNLPKDTNQSEHVLNKVYQQAATLEGYLRKSIVELTQGDLTLPLDIPLYTYMQKGTGQSGEKSLGDILADEQRKGLWLQADIKTIKQAWHQATEEICSVCGLRPLGFGATSERNEQKAISRGMCGVCLERRVKRAGKWAQGIHKSSRERLQEGYPETVWLDEVADKNGRLALIVGYFPLEHWLDGTLIESLGMFKRNSAESPPTNRRVTVEDDQGNSVEVVLGPKPVSYSRIRRVWETTRRFWQDVAPTDPPPKELETLCTNNGLKLEDLWEGPLNLEESLVGQAIGEKRPRLFLKGALEKGDLAPFHAYEMMVNGRKVAVLWVPPDATNEEGSPLEHRGGFWVLENLAYLESENAFGRPMDQVFRQNGTYEIYEPSEYGKPGKATARFTLEEPPQKMEDNYTPLIPILAEPRTFMALLPADKAVDVVRAIKAKYEREMGKVRNRLPLHLGIVFADAHQPLRTILDAGRRMMQQQARPPQWEVLCSARKQIAKRGSLPPRFSADKDNQFHEWFEVTIKADKQKITWYVPAVVGDGETEDHWYPYVFLKFRDEPSGRTRYYEAENPWSKKHPWLVHAGELRPGDVIYFAPATLDFIFLDRGGRRFEIAYGPGGRRRGTLHRPYLLDELDDLVECWHLLAGDRENKVKRLGVSQLHALRDLIETKRMEWFSDLRDSPSDTTFKKFCESVLENAQWATKPSEKELKRLTHWAVTGLLADAVELFYHIMKQRPAGEEGETQKSRGSTESAEK